MLRPASRSGRIGSPRRGDATGHPVGKDGLNVSKPYMYPLWEFDTLREMPVNGGVIGGRLSEQIQKPVVLSPAPMRVLCIGLHVKAILDGFQKTYSVNRAKRSD